MFTAENTEASKQQGREASQRAYRAGWEPAQWPTRTEEDTQSKSQEAQLKTDAYPRCTGHLPNVSESCSTALAGRTVKVLDNRK